MISSGAAAVFSGRTAANSPKMPGKMAYVLKPAQSGGLLHLDGPVGEQVFGTVYTGSQKLIVRGSVKQVTVIVLKLAFSHVDQPAHPMDVPFFLTLGEHG